LEPAASATLSNVYHPKAVIFTHFGQLQYGKDDKEWIEKKTTYLDEYTAIFQRYLQCAKEGNQLGLVYIYVDWAIRQAVPKITQTAFTIDPKHLGHENELVGLLELAEERARKSLGLGRDHPPRFRHVGLTQLVNLLNNLMEVDPKLVKFLGGLSGTLFTYDSPKFAEAVIRLARGVTPHLASDPVIRIDEDARPTAGFISRLLDAYMQVNTDRFFFFSGTYGNPNGKDDPINDHAVRVHFFADVQPRRPMLTRKQNAKATTFLADLDQLGATQMSNSQKFYSKALKTLLRAGRPQQKTSGAAQVISGAGLIMSATAIKLFPPFMNFKNLTVWVDDHLKRRLHEMASDLAVRDLECLAAARIQQERHKILAKKDIDWAKADYFDRLLRGCLFHHLITEPQGQYASLLTNIVRFRIRKHDAPVAPSELQRLHGDLIKLANERYRDVKACWSSSEFRGTPLYRWASALTKSHCSTSCEEVADDALRYVDLLLEWPVFTNAIDRLPISGNYWLFVPTS
jgi:hypothetical protein